MVGLIGTSVTISTRAQATPTSEIFDTAFETTRIVAEDTVEFPDVSSLFDPSSGVPPGFARSLVDVAIDFNENYLTIDFDNVVPPLQFASGYENTYIFTFESDLEINIENASINQALTTLGLEASDLRVVGNQLFLNVESLPFGPNTFVRIDFDAFLSLDTVQSNAADVEIAAATYQYFTGTIPTAEGFAHLISSSSNPNDLNDPYYAQFNTENRYINFSNNLGCFGEGKAAFEAKFGLLSFQDAIRVAYDEIVGIAEAEAAGINTQAALDFLIGAEGFYRTVAEERVTPAGVDADLAVKVVAIGSLLNEAVKSGVGAFATALGALTADLAGDGYSDLFGGDLFAAT